MQATTRLDYLRPGIWSCMSQAAQKKEKHQWTIEKPKLDDARKLRGIYVIDPEDGEFRETIKYARRKSEIPLEAAMTCKLRTTKRPNKLLETDSETKGSNKIQKTKHACIVEAHESTRKRLEGPQWKDHEEITLRRKGSIR